MPVDTLALPSSPTLRKSLLDVEGIYVPIELNNGCSEKDCTVDSDDPKLTNIIRKHYLERFGHRDLKAMVDGYTEDALLIEVVNGKREKYHGKAEIREALAEVFEQHPTTDSSFQLESVQVSAKHATVLWTAKTPTASYPHCTDAFVFNDEGKIVKQLFTCEVEKEQVPWYVDESGK